MAKGKIDRLNDTLGAIPDLARAYPRAFGNLNTSWLRDTLFNALRDDPYFDLDEISEDVALGDRGIIKFSSETRLRHLKRLLLLSHRILGYNSSEQTRQFKLRVKDLDDTRTQSEFSLQLARGVQLAYDSLHEVLIKTTASDNGSLIHYYSQGEDGRLNDMDITVDGWCLGVSVQWIRFRATGRTDFWRWLMTDEGAGACRFVMASQGVRFARASEDDRLKRSEFALRRFGVILEAFLNSSTPQTATPQSMARHIVGGGYQLRAIQQTYVSGGGHAMAADISRSFTFMDPNSGEVRFTSGASLLSWLPKYVRRIGYHFQNHYVEVFSHQPNLARVDQAKPETREDVLRNAMGQRRQAMGY
jgi:hypothetical protein